MKKSIILTLALCTIGLSLLSQTKTVTGYITEIICVDYCDITLKKAPTDESGEYLRITYEADGKTMKMNPEGKSFFIERENDIVLKPEFKDKQFTISYVAKGEDKILTTINLVGQNNTSASNSTPSTGISKTDSINQAFEKNYPGLKAEMKKIDLKNPAPNNPVSIATKYVSIGKKGDIAGLNQIFAQMEKLKEFNTVQADGHKKYTVRHLIKFIDGMDKTKKQNTPEAAKNEIAKIFLSNFADDNMKLLSNPVVVYVSETEAYVAISKFKGNYYFVSQVKIDGKWKIINTDDSPAFKLPLDKQIEYNKYLEKRVTEQK